MRKPPSDFSSTGENWYDLWEDWDLVEASLAKQYSLRIRDKSDMPWDEFCALVGGLMPDTPLGQIVSIRAEKDPAVIKSFTPDQKRIRDEWMRRVLSNTDEATLEQQQKQVQDMLAKMFGKGVI